MTHFEQTWNFTPVEGDPSKTHMKITYQMFNKPGGMNTLLTKKVAKKFEGFEKATFVEMKIMLTAFVASKN